MAIITVPSATVPWQKQFHGESISLRTNDPDPEVLGPPGPVIIGMDQDPDTPITSKTMKKTFDFYNLVTLDNLLPAVSTGNKKKTKKFIFIFYHL